VLDPLGPIASKRMFGGVGLYVLYLKADEAARDAREKAGARPFQPFPDRPKGKGRMQYYSVPAAILEDAEALLAWAKEAVAIDGANS